MRIVSCNIPLTCLSLSAFKLLNGSLIFTYIRSRYITYYIQMHWYNNLYLRYFYESTLFSHLLSRINKFSIFKSWFFWKLFRCFQLCSICTAKQVLFSWSWVLNKVYNFTVWRLEQGIFLGRMPWTGYTPWWCVVLSFIFQIKKSKEYVPEPVISFIQCISHHNKSCLVLLYDCSNLGTRKITESQLFWKHKVLKYFCKRTDNIHKFECFFLRRQASSNGFIVLNGCIVEPWILLVRFQKNLNLLFSKKRDWIVFFQVPRFE